MERNSFHGLDIINYLATKLCNISKSVLSLFPCQIMGSPKPKESPHYPNFYFGKYNNLLVGAELNNIAWILARLKSRSTEIISTEDTNEIHPLFHDIPLRVAFNFEVSSQDHQHKKDNGHH